MTYKKIEGHEGYVKDINGVILNVNNDEIEASKKRKELMRQKENEINKDPILNTLSASCP